MGLTRAVATAAAALAACGGAAAGSVNVPASFGGGFNVPATSLAEARYLATIRQQYDFSCGSAALSTLLTHHYGRAVGERAVFEHMFRHGEREKIRREGFSMLDMKRYLEAHGLQADGFEASLDKLAEARIPAIVLVNENGYNHFVVVKGVLDGRVLFGDPAGGTRAMPRDAFETLWENGIVFVITNGAQPRFNTAEDWAVVPRAPLADGVQRDGLTGIVLPRHGSSDF
jgi:predicted double-glycine peptidase